MTETPQEHVARLQRELAQAKVAELQQELAQAQSQAQGYPPAPQAPSMGWQPAAPVDAGPLGAAGSMQRAQFIQSVLTQVQGASAYLTGSPLTGSGGPGPNSPGMEQPLSAPPRHVPFSFKAAMLPWKWWDAFTLLMVGVTPIAAWIVMPAVAAAVGFIAIITLCYFRLRGLRTRIGVLKWGVVAQVRSAGPLSVGTYYSGTTYSNVRLPVAHGWQVSRQWYSGPGYKTKIVYDVGGAENQLILHGREYVDGVILANSRRPEIALCVSQFPYDLNRDEAGNWKAHVGAGLWIGSILQAALYLAWTGFAVYLATTYWPPLLKF